MIRNGALTPQNTIHNDGLWEKFCFNIKEKMFGTEEENYVHCSEFGTDYVYNGWRTLRRLEPT